MQQLLDDVALRIRHNAAMDNVETAGGELERYELLWQVLLPSRRLLDHSLTAAVDELHHRHDKAAA